MKPIGMLVLSVLLCLAGCRSTGSGEGGWVYYPKALSGVDGDVSALAIHDSILYAAGNFKLAGKVKARNIAAWDGHAWSALGEGISGQINSITVDGKGILYACYWGGESNFRISKWNGLGWQIIADTIDGSIGGMLVDSANRLLIYGRFTRGRKYWESKGEEPPETESAARWDGASWSRLNAPGPLIVDAKGQVFSYATDSEEGVARLQAYRLVDTAIAEFGSGLPLNGSGEKGLQVVFDGMQRILVANQFTNEKEDSRLQLSRLETDGEWRSIPSDIQLMDLNVILPDRNQPSRFWIGDGGCLYAMEGKSSKQIGNCHNGALLVQMPGGQLVTAGKAIYTRSGSQVNIAKMSGDDWVGIDTTGADNRAGYPFWASQKRELLRRIPEKNRPVYLAEGNMDDIIEDKHGGLYVSGKFYFEKNGAYFRHLTYWKGGAYSPLGGGLYAPGGGMKLALSPDGTLYAANASLSSTGSFEKTSLYRWDGRMWHFVRRTPRINDMAFDKHGSLYALVQNQNGSPRSFCRIALEGPDGSIESMEGGPYGAGHLEVDDSLVHLYGDFLMAGDFLSPGHAAWRFPEGSERIPLAEIASPISASVPAISASNRIRIIQEGRDEIHLLDSALVGQTARYSLYNSTGAAFDTVYLEMKRIDSLRIESYSQGQSYDIPATDYSILPHPGGYRITVRLKAPVTSKDNVPLNISILREGLLAKIPPDGYLFQDTLSSLVANRYEDGDEEANSIHIDVGADFPIQGRRHPKDTLVKDLAGASSFKWIVRRDPDRLEDPFFSHPDHKSKWYSRLLDCGSDLDSNLMQEHPLPAGLTKEAVFRDLWRDPIAPSDSEVEIGCNVYAERWKAQKDSTFLVFFETTFHFQPTGGGMIQDKRKLRIGLYRKVPGGGMKLAGTAEPRDFEADERVTSLDFAPYKLTEKEFAFGVRMGRRFMYGRGGGYSSSLTLFRVEGENLKPILSTLMDSHSTTAGDEDEDGFRSELEHDGGSATLAVLNRKTRGVYDFRKSGEDKKSAVFKWDGGSYELYGKDPVTEVNED